MIPQPQLVPQLTTTSHLESTLAILTEEGTTIEADGGLACHLGSIKDCVIELVREGKGLWTKGRRLKWGRFTTKASPDIVFPQEQGQGPRGILGTGLDCPPSTHARAEGTGVPRGKEPGPMTWDLGHSRAGRRR